MRILPRAVCASGNLYNFTSGIKQAFFFRDELMAKIIYRNILATSYAVILKKGIKYVLGKGIVRLYFQIPIFYRLLYFLYTYFL